MTKLSPNKQLVLNLSATLIVFTVNAVISFFLTPFIVNQLGVEANGFIQLASNFVSYIAIMTMALTSVVARFIMMAYHENDEQKASQYYSSTFIGNLAILLALFIPVILGIVFLDSFIMIPYYLITQVRLLFFFVFLNFFLTTIFPSWSVAFFVTNHMYLQSIGKIIFGSVKAFLIILMFSFFPAQIWYIGMAMTFSTLALQCWNYLGKKKLMPNISFKMKSVSANTIKILLSSGIWNSINQVGVVLSSGLTLILTNIFIDNESMGIVSIAKIVPNMLEYLQFIITKNFVPNMTMLYAKGEITKLVSEIFKASKILLVILGIPFSGFIVFGEIFFSLWMPSQDSQLLQILSILSMVNIFFLLGIQPLWHVFKIVNKNKSKSLAVILQGIVAIILIFLALHTTNWGIFAILGISVISALVRNLIFTIPFSARYLGLKWHVFFPLVGLTLVTLVLNYGLGFLLNHVFSISSWQGLIGVACIFSILSLFLNSLIILNKRERQAVIGKFFCNGKYFKK